MKTLQSRAETAEKKIDDIINLVCGATSSRFDRSYDYGDALQEIRKLVAFKANYEGKESESTRLAGSHKEIIRWLINPDTAVEEKL